MDCSQIMIVEDEPVIAKDIKYNLEQYGYYIPSIATSSDEALRNLSISKPDLILMDIKLGGTIDGIDLAGEINAKFDIPVIYLTAYTDKLTLDRALQTSPYGYLSKPINNNELQTAIETALRISNKSKQAFQKLDKLQYIHNNMHTAVITTDAILNIKTCNPKCAKLLGYQQSNLTRMNINQLLHNNEQHTLADLTGHYDKSPLHYNLQFATHDEQVIDTITTVQVLRSQNKITTIIFEIIQPPKTDTSMAIYDNALNAIANTSHEIRNPINLIMGYSDLLEDYISDDEYKRYLALLKSSAQQVLSIANDILDQSKIEAGTLDINDMPFSIKEIFETTYTNTQILISQYNKSISLKKSISPEVHDTVIGDPVRLQQILTNLLNNAVKFTREGEIAYGVWVLSDTTLLFFVKDSGIGINKNDQGKLFKRFKKLDTNARGNGLGLYICKQLVEKMGGSISVESETGVDHGTNITFTLNYKAYHKRKIIPKPSGDSPKNHSILLVEDNKTSQVLLKSYFEKLGYSIRVATTGTECINIIKAETNTGLILMDLHLPDISGIEVIKKIRSLEKYNKSQAIPIVALTASTTYSDVQQCLSAGCNNYLHKPIMLSNLKNIVNRYLDQQPATAIL